MTDSPLRFDGGIKIDTDGHRPRPCRHRAVRLEVEARDVVCRRCGKVLDPFDTLLMYSDMGARQVRRHEGPGHHLETRGDRVRDGQRTQNPGEWPRDGLPVGWCRARLQSARSCSHLEAGIERAGRPRCSSPGIVGRDRRPAQESIPHPCYSRAGAGP